MEALDDQYGVDGSVFLSEPSEYLKCSVASVELSAILGVIEF